MDSEHRVHALGDGVWIDREPVSMFGVELASTMTLVRLHGGSLLVHSPISLTPARRTTVESLGPVAHLYAPNAYHSRWLKEWTAAYPDARVHAPAELRDKRPELRIDRVHQAGREPAFDDVVEEVRIDGCRLYETVLFVRPLQTLIVADLVHNIGKPVDKWSAFYSNAMGFYDRVAISRALRWTAFSDRAAARKSLDAILALPFVILIVGHGTPLTRDAKAALRAAYVWLG